MEKRKHGGVFFLCLCKCVCAQAAVYVHGRVGVSEREEVGERKRR